MLDIPSVSGIVAAVGVLVGVVFTVLQLRDLVKTRQTDLVIRLYSTFGSKEFQEAWVKVLTAEFKGLDDFMKKYGPVTNTEAWAQAESVSAFFEGIGVLLHRKLINIGLVDDLLSSPIKYTWEKIEPIVNERRKRFKRPQIWEWFEYLYSQLQKREQTPQT